MEEGDMTEEDGEDKDGTFFATLGPVQTPCFT